MSDAEGAAPPNTAADNTSNKEERGNTPQQQANNNNSRNNKNYNRNSRNNNRNNTFTSDHPKDWKGDRAKIGVILGLKSEKLSNKATVDALLEKLEGYAKKDFDFYDDVLPLFNSQ